MIGAVVRAILMVVVLAGDLHKPGMLLEFSVLKFNKRFALEVDSDFKYSPIVS